jgi:hypothetical protein
MTTTANTEPAPAAMRLGRGRKTQNWLAVALVISVLVNIATPIYYSIAAKHKDEVVVFDLASGSLVVSPLVDPSASKEVLELSASWAAKCLLDRSPAGPDNEQLISILFDTSTAKKLRDEFNGLKTQYTTKHLRSRVEIKAIDAQPIGQGFIKAHVIGQVVITGVLNGSAIQEVQPVAVDFNLARNPDLGRNKRYPLMCFGYEYAKDPTGITQK